MIGSNILDIEDIVSEVIIKDYIPLHKGNYNVLTGAGGCGKSQISLKMLAHFLQANPNERAVAFYTEDTKKTIIERLDAITSYTRITTKEIVDRTFFTTLDNYESKPFIKKINRLVEIDISILNSFIGHCCFNNVGLIIFDPLEAFHSGLSENDAEEMKMLVTNVFQRIGVETGSAVLVLHHTSKGNEGGSRGSVVITNKGRIAYNIRRIKEHDKNIGVDVIKKGWENSVLLTTIKDNHFIARYCETLRDNNGKLKLPISKYEQVIEYTTKED